MWHSGPKFLYSQDSLVSIAVSREALEAAEDDPEVRPLVKTLVTRMLPNKCLGSSRFSRFSRWQPLVMAIARLISFVQSIHFSQKSASSLTNLHEAKLLIIQTIQHETYKDEINRLTSSGRLPKTSPLLKSSPVVDKDGLLRVGGRLEQAGLNYEEQHPLILPASHHVTTLLVNYYHERVLHQGRHFTLGLIRSSGLWIFGAKRLVNSVINSCIKCKKLRGHQQIQKMADLPVQRLTPAPPFSYVGLDVFGPWLVSTRRTRGGAANSKRWAVLFTCMATQAFHIELIESLDISSFINALRRFLALRGPAIQLRSDCGTNFVGARNELQSCLKEMDDSLIQSYLANEGCEWVFNPPHASHAGGVWERMIGITHRILEAILANLRPKHLTHEVLSTLMAEVAAIVNARPLVPVPTDPDMPEILTPATLLTQKSQSLKSRPRSFSCQDLYSKQWRQVQYLPTCFGLVREENICQRSNHGGNGNRNQETWKRETWFFYAARKHPGKVGHLRTRVYPSTDGKVRKVDLVTAKDGSTRSYTRPVTEVILLKTEKDLVKMKTSVG